MDKEKLLVEYNSTKLALVDKINFIFSEKFHGLSELEKKRYIADKNATEAHLTTLSNVLWAKGDEDINSNFLSLFFLSSIFNGGGMWGGSSPSMEHLKNELEKEKADEHERDEHFAVPV